MKPMVMILGMLLVVSNYKRKEKGWGRALQYEIWKHYLNQGMSDQEASNNVNALISKAKIHVRWLAVTVGVVFGCMVLR
jgi:hypothetical protein